MASSWPWTKTSRPTATVALSSSMGLPNKFPSLFKATSSTRKCWIARNWKGKFQLAREIQQTFLPSQIPPMPGWEMDVRWNTAQQVGGDFYDYFLLPDGRLAIIIADVSNKGLAASLYMTVTRTLIRAAALESTSPARTLERVNDLLLMNSQNGLFVTTWYGLLDMTEGRPHIHHRRT